MAAPVPPQPPTPPVPPPPIPQPQPPVPQPPTPTPRPQPPVPQPSNPPVPTAPPAPVGGSTSSSASPVSPVITTSAIYPPQTNYTGALIGLFALILGLVGWYWISAQQVAKAAIEKEMAIRVQVDATKTVQALQDAVRGLERAAADATVPTRPPAITTTGAPPAVATPAPAPVEPPPPSVGSTPSPATAPDTNAPSASVHRRGAKKEPETVIVNNDNRSYHYYQEKVVTEPRQELPSSSPPLPEGGVQFKRFPRHFYFTPPAGVPVVEVSGPNTGTIYLSDY